MDAGRGLAIVLVVLVHARDWISAGVTELHAWDLVNSVLAGLRMPLFFTVSGMLGAGWATRPWRELTARKVVPLVWVYLVWQPVGLAAALLADRFTGGSSSPAHLVLALLATVVRPRSELWFLWALAVYFVISRLGGRRAATAQLVLAASVSAVWLSGWGPDGNLGWSGVPKYYVFFLVGVRHRRSLALLAESSRRRPAASAAVVSGWAVTAAVTTMIGADQVVGVGLATRALGLCAGVAVAAWTASSGLLRALGRRTLPVYLAHTPLIAVVVWILNVHRTAAWVAGPVQLWPLLVTAAVIPVTLLLHRTAPRAGLAWLYRPPPRLVSRCATPGSWTGQIRGGVPAGRHVAWKQPSNRRLALSGRSAKTT